MSAPQSNGRCRYGVQKVLSTATRMPLLVCESADRGDVCDLEIRVGWRLEEDQPGFWLQSFTNGFEVRGIDEGCVDAEPRQRVAEERERAAVEDPSGDDVVAGLQQSQEDRGDRGHSG